MRLLQAARKLMKNILHGGAPERLLLEAYRTADTAVRYAAYESDIVFDGYTWTRKGFKVGLPPADLVGTQQEFPIAIEDADLTETDRLAAGEYVGQAVRLLLVNLDNLADSADRIVFRGLVLHGDVRDGQVTLDCGSYSRRDATIPRETLDRDRCNNQFKDPLGRCGYSGGATACAKTLIACAALANKPRFRGAPGMPKRRP